MRRVLVSLLAAVLLACVPAVALAQTEIQFKAIVLETFGRSASPTQVGKVQGFGFVTEEFTFTGEQLTGDPDCPVMTTGFTTWTFSDGSTLITQEEYVRCPPGESGAAPGGEVSYGNPAVWIGSWEVSGGTGTFACATGSGSIFEVEAGERILLLYEGTISLDC